MFPRITHIALHVVDIESCIDFYQLFCGMQISHQRTGEGKKIVWLAEPGRENDFIFVLMSGGVDLELGANDYRHFGFAVQSRDEVDKIAEKARDNGCLLWEPVDEPWPVGYYCGLKDPNGNYVEFSYGQPLGPGAEPISAID